MKFGVVRVEISGGLAGSVAVAESGHSATKLQGFGILGMAGSVGL